ncbi:hypothetical protein O4H52_18545 [Sphingomonadaceae bacterium G21617-S1]|jgi:hypothetical protein|uniref:hypothetical protein n=1 Tax=Rhizorhabdus sp. TaxID=1968843 RepID=UPI00121920A4|nr:hypothetical protein [Rhizorhabdus sp.]MBD3761135.1 hypothetical protein [Rhizorhabdus sp.]MCZ4343616.1 hypothetical protein [Sphingomonadaceae bacterium G21617-S1]TAK10692.1 MAG: hypothetical protein EPO38_07505 [Rhizorhabdus sp.]
MLTLLFQLLFFAVLIPVCSYAAWCGGWPERAGAMILVAATILTIVAATTFNPTWDKPETGIFLVDLMMLAALVNLALYSDRYWPLWVTSFHLIAVTIHLATLVDRSVAALAYANAAEFWAYPMMGTLAYGTWNHRRRQASTRRENAARY